MRRLILFLIVFTMLAAGFAGSARAQASRIYFAGYLGLNHSPALNFSESVTPSRGDIEIQDSPTFAGALGLRLSPQWRVEGELSYRSAGADKISFSGGAPAAATLGGDLKTWLLMLNVFYDFNLKWDYLNPYLTAGIGLARNSARFDDTSANNIDASDTTMNMAWQLGGGLKYRVKKDLALTGGYRYLGMTSPEIGSYTVDYSGHEFRLGVEYDLPVSRMK